MWFVVHLTGPERRAGIKVGRKSGVLAANSPRVRGILMSFTLKRVRTHRTHTDTHRLSSGATICNVVKVLMRGNRTGDGRHTETATWLKLGSDFLLFKSIFDQRYLIYQRLILFGFNLKISKLNFLKSTMPSDCGRLSSLTGELLKYFQANRCTNCTVRTK